MRKENGRLTPINRTEESSTKGKLFKCDTCSGMMYVPNVEFGEISVCPECGGTMSEHIDYFD